MPSNCVGSEEFWYFNSRMLYWLCGSFSIIGSFALLFCTFYVLNHSKIISNVFFINTSGNIDDFIKSIYRSTSCAIWIIGFLWLLVYHKNDNTMIVLRICCNWNENILKLVFPFHLLLCYVCFLIHLILDLISESLSWKTKSISLFCVQAVNLSLVL